MKLRILFLAIFLVFFILSDFYTWKALVRVFPQFGNPEKRLVWIYWGIKLFFWGLLFWVFSKKTPRVFRQYIMTGFLAIYAGQLFVLLFAWIDEIRRAGILFSGWFKPENLKGLVPSKLSGSLPESLPDSISGSLISPSNTSSSNPLSKWESIPRSEFLAKTGLTLGSLAFMGMSTTSTRSIYDYRVRKVNLFLPNLPSEFEGLQIAQISDIHSGSFFDEKAVSKGIDLLLSLKPDMVFFTGDLVNNRADEMKDYQKIFARIKAPLGVYSILGNHDYGDYNWWPSEKEKSENLKTLIQIHKDMGYNILMNENRTIQIGNQKISILGVENWSALSQFPKHGRLDLAIQGTEDIPVKLLLSHDPSHWKAQILPDFSQIDVTFSGHTHGMQMGIRLPHFQWSPVQYVYPEWAGLYKEGNQQIYVNVGFGFLGYPGRIGMYPEITLFNLTAKNAKKA